MKPACPFEYLDELALEHSNAALGRMFGVSGAFISALRKRRCPMPEKFAAKLGYVKIWQFADCFKQPPVSQFKNLDVKSGDVIKITGVRAVPDGYYYWKEFCY